MATKTKPEDAGPSFEQKLARLEELAEAIRQGNVSIEDASVYFEEGMRLAKSLEHELSKIERKVEILINEPAVGEKPLFELFPELGEIAEKKD